MLRMDSVNDIPTPRGPYRGGSYVQSGLGVTINQMPTNREPLNPYEPPKSVDSPRRTRKAKQEGLKSKELRYQLIGFIVLWKISLLALAVGVPTALYANKIGIWPPWNWLVRLLQSVGVFISMGGFAFFAVSSPWILITIFQRSRLRKGE